MDSKLKGKVAIVTGASRGIGRAIAEGLAAEGAAVAVNHRASAAQAQEVVAAIERVGGRAAAIQANVALGDDTRRLVRETIEEFGFLDILVNNAGMGAVTPFSQVTEEQFDGEFAVNARGPFFLVQEAAPLMREGGRIINISSSGTHNAQFSAHLAVYLMAKGALEQIAHTFARELGTRGITVNSVLPGLTETELAGQIPEDRRRFIIARTALGRTGLPQEIASAVVFLAGDGGRWITGQTISVNGGLE
jgi:3-oxoacyl-[acyl-carrier protein] reductase